MKSILLTLFLGVLFIGCSEKRVLIDRLTNKGTEEIPLMYIEEGLFSGVAYDVYSNGDLKLEITFKNGIAKGDYRLWYKGGVLKLDYFFEDRKVISTSCFNEFEEKIECYKLSPDYQKLEKTIIIR